MEIRALILTNHPIEDGSNRYRIYQYLPELERVGVRCVVRPFTTPGLFRAMRRQRLHLGHCVIALFCVLRRIIDVYSLSRYDVVLIHREAFPFFTPYVEQMILSRHSRVVYSFDDAIYAGHQTPQRGWLYRLKYGKGIDEVLRRAHLIIAGNGILAAHAEQHNQNVIIIPTTVDTEVYRPRRKSDDPVITIGWYGSNSTGPYLQMIATALQEIARRYPNRIRFKFYGLSSPPFPLPGLMCQHFNLATELDDLSSLDIGLMPMPNDIWSQGKCGFKAIQYMALGIPAIASPVGMTTDLIEHGINGFCADTSEEWIQYLDLLITDPERRRSIGIEARRTIVERYSHQRWAPVMAQSVKHLAAGGVR